MNSVSLELIGGDVLGPDGAMSGSLSIAHGKIQAAPADTAKRVDLSGFLVLPGIIDMHGDGFEHHLAPRRGAMRDLRDGLIAAEAELAANGITTAMLAQFYSWEGGMRGPDFARRFLHSLRQMQAHTPLGTDLHVQLRFETHMLDAYEDFANLVEEFAVPYVVFNDHLPHDALTKGKRPPRLTGQALKGGRSPEAHLKMLQDLHENAVRVSGAVADLAAQLAGQGVILGSHDDPDAHSWAQWQSRGAALCEFPLSAAAAEAAKSSGAGVILGAPNVVRGGSHSGNVSAADLVKQGLCDALASDYHYPAPHLAAMQLSDQIGLAAAWALVSAGPARLLGLSDRGALSPGMRADVTLIDPATRRVGATLSGGRVTYLSGPVGARFFA